MASSFDLIVTANTPNRTAELRLLDEHGVQLWHQLTEFKKFPVSRLQALFDLRNYLRNYVETGHEASAVAEVGVAIAEQVLGAEIFKLLWAGESQRSLRIQLPGATEEQNLLAAALARVPWEIARPAPETPTLAERNVAVRVVHEGAAPASQALELGKEETLRVLFVFAEARGSRPLAARKERRQLARLFEQEIYPHRRIEADFLAHGVTREQLREQIEDRGGYHVVHWSGHGHLNLLELAKAGGKQDRLSGEELLGLFTEAGGFIPRMFFLSACHSGDILRVKDWNSFLAAAAGKEAVATGSKEALPEPAKDVALPEASGFTGTAHALLAGGVRSVVAMRYEVGDEYARELALDFYEALLADSKPKTVAAALTQARRKLRDEKNHARGSFAACDHATPLLYGEEELNLALPKGRSPALDTRSPRLHQIAELTTAQHEHFVGRTWELAGLGAEFIGSKGGEEVKPVAVITGLGGMGKTALVAEALSLWERRFEWVLLYQAKPNALPFDGTLRDIHLKLVGELGRYHEHVKQRPADAIYRQADAEFTGEERLERLTRNLVRALQDEPILLVLDNFETCLKPSAEPGDPAKPTWACQDPAWDRCLARLATELVGSPSRLLITCRKPLAALARKEFHPVLLGPLPASEAQLYVREHAGLSAMIFGSDEKERDLAVRLLNASRFHPLLMDRLARLATAGQELRPQLMQALVALESSQGSARLPALFTTKPGDEEEELAYLNDALAASLNQLLEGAGAEARRLLWVIALANEPVTTGLLTSVWVGKEAEEKPNPAPLLHHLVAVGLVTEERMGPEDQNPDLTCHELVRERIQAWMAEHGQDQGERTENQVRLAYAERLAATFKALQHKNMALALQAGSRAIVYCVQSQAWERLGDFASAVVTSTRDPRLLAGLLPYLEAAAEAAPEGRPRWLCLSYLADALSIGGQPDVSLLFFEQAAAQTRTAAAETGSEGSRQAWADLATITGNWATALRFVGNLDASRQRHLDSAEASKKGGRAAVHVIGRELEALRIDVLQGLAAQALPEVEGRLALVNVWWRQHESGRPVSEAPDPEFLARTLIAALDIANDADRAQGNWSGALHRSDEALELKLALQRPADDIAATRMDRALELVQLRRFSEAKVELEACLQTFQSNSTQRARTLGCLAYLFRQQGDLPHAILQARRALAMFEQLPSPTDRATQHNHVFTYLKHSGTPAALTEAPHHQLAALLYQLVSRQGQEIQTSLHNYAIDFRRARATGTPLTVPRLAELLAEPAFRPLGNWLRDRGENLETLQTRIDQRLEQVRQAVEAEA